MGLEVTERYSEHIPERVINVSGTTGMWDVPVTTERTILANRPDKYYEKTCLLIDMAIPADSNGNTEETVKRSNYKDLNIGVSRMWKLRTKLCQF
jgi:hypothetical protein